MITNQARQTGCLAVRESHIAYNKEFYMHKLLSKSHIHSRIASRNHSCCECGQEIAINDHYVHIHGICDGFKLNFIQCNSCHTVFRNAYAVIDTPDDGPCITELPSWIHNIVSAYPCDEDYLEAIASSLDVAPAAIRNLYNASVLQEKIA